MPLITGKVSGGTVKLKAEKKARPKNRPGKTVHIRETVAVPERIREFYRYKCGPYLTVRIRENIGFPQKSRGRTSTSRRRYGPGFRP